MKKLLITVKTVYNFEKPLQEELEELGYKNSKILNRAVQLEGDWKDVYRLNYRCRLAISVLVQIDSFTIHKEDDLYKKASRIDWPSYFDVDKTFAVKGAVFSTLFRHSQYPLLVVKDAIADSFRKQFGKRPDVNVKAPQVMFDVYINEKSVVVSLNTSGVPLFQRGYRQETGEAPMNEVLAAGILRLSGWDRKSTFIDPMCGSGTIAIEAALWAADIPAMIERSHYAFKNFKSFEEKTWEKVQNEGNKYPIDLGFEILAYDIDGEMIQKAKRNSKVAPIGNMIKFERLDALELEPNHPKGVLICNPPYDERMEEDVTELYQGLGDLFKNSFVGFDCWIVSANMDALKSVGLRPSQKIKVFNGNLECSLRQYQIFEGSKKEKFFTEHTEEEQEEVNYEAKEQEEVKREVKYQAKQEGEKKEEKREVKYKAKRETLEPQERKTEEKQEVKHKAKEEAQVQKEVKPGGKYGGKYTASKYTTKASTQSVQKPVEEEPLEKKEEIKEAPLKKKEETPTPQKEESSEKGNKYSFKGQIDRIKKNR